MRMCKCVWALVAVALSGAALSAQPEWKPVGELQVASMKVMAPQIAELGRQANFTLLPMLVRQWLAATEPGIAFGAPMETADWGMKLFMRENVLAAVTVWPVAKPPAADKPHSPSVYEERGRQRLRRERPVVDVIFQKRCRRLHPKAVADVPVDGP